MSQQKDRWFEIENIGEIDTPCLVVYPERVKSNIRTLVSMTDDVQRLRPHVKTNKSVEAGRLMMAAGIRKFKCATISEAEMLGIAGAPDVVLAYQPIGPKVARLVQVIKRYPDTRYACLTDNLKAAEQMAKQFAENDLEVEVYIDLNLGMNRTGIEPGPAAFKLYLAVFGLRGLNLRGLHAYDGHIRDANLEKRTQQCDAAFESVTELKELIVGHGLPVPVIIAGGTPTFPIHIKRQTIECSPGTFVYWDGVYRELCPEQEFLHAAVLLTRVISLPDATKICIDLGHKSVASESELSKRVRFLNALELEPVSQNEEHLVLEAEEGHPYAVGDILYGVPWHICPTVALYERVLTIENGTMRAEWKNIARDRKIEC